MFIKLSIGIFLLRLAVLKTYRYILRVSLAVVFVWSMVMFFFNWFQCNPAAGKWDMRVEAECISVQQVVAAAYGLSAMCILTDFFYVGC